MLKTNTISSGIAGLFSLYLIILSLPSWAAETSAGDLRLYILDCGTIDAMDPQLFGLAADELSGDGSFVSPCYLIVHPAGTLLWEAGQVPSNAVP